jgi:hypothetical protein
MKGEVSALTSKRQILEVQASIGELPNRRIARKDRGSWSDEFKCVCDQLLLWQIGLLARLGFRYGIQGAAARRAAVALCVSLRLAKYRQSRAVRCGKWWTQGVAVQVTGR